MNRSALIILATVPAAPSLAQEHRRLEANEHGVARVNIAFEGNHLISMASLEVGLDARVLKLQGRI